MTTKAAFSKVKKYFVIDQVIDEDTLHCMVMPKHKVLFYGMMVGGVMINKKDKSITVSYMKQAGCFENKLIKPTETHIWSVSGEVDIL